MQFFKYLKKYPFLSFISYFLYILLALDAVVVIYLSSQLIYAAGITKNINDLYLVLIVNIVLFCLGVIIFLLSRFTKNKFLNKINSDLIFDLVENISKEKNSDFKINGKSHYISEIKNFNDFGFENTFSKSHNLIYSLSFLTISIIFFFVINPIIGAIAISIIIFLNIIPYFLFSRISRKQYENIYKIFGQNHENINRSFSKYKAYYLFGKNKFFFFKLEKQTRDFLDSALKKYKILIFVELFQSFAQILAFIVFIFISIVLIIEQKIVQLDYSTFLIINLFFITGDRARDFGGEVIMFFSHLPYLKFSNKDKKIVNLNENISEINFKKIEIKNLTFGYENEEKKIFDNFNFVFEIGKKYAIVGPSGSGKSTLIDILTKNIENYEGKILVDGKDLKSIDKTPYYNSFTFLDSTEFIFKDSIYNNVTLWETNNETSAYEALKKAQLSKKILDKFSQKDSFENLSTGEKQRINFAIHFYRNKNFLILDEALSNLDKNNVEALSKQLFSNKDLLLINVTHHLDENNNDYDEIIRMNEIGDLSEKTMTTI